MANGFGLLHFDWNAPLSDEERDQMLDKIAASVGKWRMEVPTILFLESGGPLSPLAGQGLVAFSPFVAPILPQGIFDVQKLSKLLEPAGKCPAASGSVKRNAGRARE